MFLRLEELLLLLARSGVFPPFYILEYQCSQTINGPEIGVSDFRTHVMMYVHMSGRVSITFLYSLNMGEREGKVLGPTLRE